MKIYYPLLCYYPSEAGGPANSIYWLNEALANEGLKCIVTSTKFGIPIYRKAKTENIYHPSNSITFKNKIYNFFTKNEVSKVVSSDIVHFSSIFFGPTIPLLFMAKIFGKSIVISPRGELYPSALDKSKFIKVIYLLLFNLISRDVFFHATNEVEKDYIKNRFEKNQCIIIPNMMPIKIQKKNTFKEQILFLGRINVIKNIDVIIDALYILKIKHGLFIKLIIAGEAKLESEKKYLRKLIELIASLDLKAQVVFLGQVEGVAKQNLLSESKCLVLPSKSENFGNVVIEALSYGTPVIASKGTPWSILETKNAGFWINPSPEELSTKLIYILGLNKDDYEFYSLNAQKLVNDFNIEVGVKKWVDFYKKIIKV